MRPSVARRNGRDVRRRAEVKRSRHCVRGGFSLFSFTAKMPELAVENVVVHPLVLLSVVDHFNR